MKSQFPDDYDSIFTPNFENNVLLEESAPQKLLDECEKFDAIVHSGIKRFILDFENPLEAINKLEKNGVELFPIFNTKSLHAGNFVYN